MQTPNKVTSNMTLSRNHFLNDCRSSALTLSSQWKVRVGGIGALESFLSLTVTNMCPLLSSADDIFANKYPESFALLIAITRKGFLLNICARSEKEKSPMRQKFEEIIFNVL